MKNSIFLSMVAIATVMSSCSTSSRSKVDRDVSEQSEIESPHQAAASGRFAVKQSQHLTEEEKMQFLALIDRTELSVFNIKKKEGQLKAALFQSLSQRRLNPTELNIYKQKLKSLEDEKLNLMFSSLDEVRKLLRADRSEDLEKEILNYYQSTLER